MWRPTLFWVPQFALRLAMGREMVDETVLLSGRILPHALISAGFKFEDSTLEDALKRELYAKYDAVSQV